MIVQKLTYPESAEFNQTMYIRCNCNHVALIGEEHKIVSTNCYNKISFDTYYSTFSYEKWKKYSKLQNVKLSIDIKGKCRLVLIGLELHGTNIDKTVLNSCIVDNPERKTVILEYPDNLSSKTLSFTIFPLSATLEIYEGAYISDIPENELSDVMLSLAICTYRREPYIARNMQMLKKYVFDNPNSPLYGHVRVVIADNGNTLDASAFDPEYIRIIPNKNSGGSGGFSRAAIEIIEDKTVATSHIILMDDDIVFNADALERNYIFLRLLKPEYKTSMIGGAMFRTDNRYIQHAAGETQTVDGIIFNKIGYDMRKLEDVMRNDVEERINYLGWWYCCIPAALFETAHYSLPLFVQYDDIEFSLRNNTVPKITLNGICCWHLPFDKKWSAFKNYYTIRNRTIVNTLCFETYTKTRFMRDVLRSSVKCLFQYGYKEANLVLLGAEDYLKGLSWLAEQDPVNLNKKVISLSDKLVEPDKLPIDYDPRNLQLNKDFYLTKRHTLKSLLTINGWLLPANRTVTVEVDNPPIRYFYRAGNALKYDVNTGKALVTQKEYKQAMHIIGRIVKLAINTQKNYDHVKNENRKMREGLTTKEFWKDYLNF